MVNEIYYNKGVESLVRAYYALGLPKKAEIEVEDVNPCAISRKISNPDILRAIGVDNSLVDACNDAEMSANLLDAFSETGSMGFLYFADYKYQHFLAALPLGLRGRIKIITASALSYFHIEQYFSERIKRKDQITLNEAITYHMARGADAQIYAELARASQNNANYKGLISGFRIRQALWDLQDEIRDIKKDSENLGVNILRMANLHKGGRLKNFARAIYRQSLSLDIPKVLKRAIRDEYNKIKLTDWRNIEESIENIEYTIEEERYKEEFGREA